MKKFISVLLLLALLISCCACNANPDDQTEPTETTETTEPTEVEIVNGVKKPDLSDVNEFEPNSKGVYEIYTKEGFLNIANHPDAEFELLWHIDMEGAAWTPIGTEDTPFTGEIDGGQFTVSNLTISAPTADGDMGMFGVMEGQVKDLTLSNVTVTTTADTKRAGIWAGYNGEDGQFLRCYVESSSVTMAEAADNAAVGAIVGVNEGEFRNGTMDVDLVCTATGKADVSGIAGYAASGKIQFVKNAGIIDVTGGSNKNVGLFAGSVTKDAEIKGAVFLGEKSDIDGEMFLSYTGTGDAAQVTDCLWRDNVKPEISAEIQAARDKVEKTMRGMGEIIWTVPRTLKYTCTCSLGSCAGLYQPGIEIHGIVYNHKSSSLARIQSCLDENNMLKEEYFLGDFDGFDRYIGSDCSAAVQQAYMAVSSTIEFLNTRNMVPMKGAGTVAVGDWAWDLETVPTYFDVYMEASGEETMYESYAQLRKGDFIVSQVEAGGHTRLVAADAVVVRDANGKIDGMESYITTHEQGAPRTTEPYFSSWRVDYKYSFSSIFVDWYVPCTIEEFITGEFVEPEVKVVNSVDGKFGMTTGIVDANFYLDSVELTVTDSQGNQVFTQRMFTAVGKSSDANNNVIIRRNTQDFDLAKFATPLREFMFELGEEYTYTITAYLGSGDDFVVKEGSFVNGTAA